MRMYVDYHRWSFSSRTKGRSTRLSESHGTLVAHKLHRIAADAAPIFVHLVILYGDDLDLVLLEELPSLYRARVHDDSARFDRDPVGRKKFDLITRAFDQFIADLVQSANRFVVAPRRIDHRELRVEWHNPHIRMHPTRHFVVIAVERPGTVGEMYFLVARALQDGYDLRGALPIAV